MSKLIYQDNLEGAIKQYFKSKVIAGVYLDPVDTSADLLRIIDKMDGLQTDTLKDAAHGIGEAANILGDMIYFTDGEKLDKAHMEEYVSSYGDYEAEKIRQKVITLGMIATALGDIAEGRV